MRSPCRYYLNALFDLELGGFPADSVQRSAAEMTALFVPLMQPGDTILLDVELPDACYSYLQGYGLAQGNPLLYNRDVSGRLNDVVWGWNREAVMRLGAVNDRHMPPLEIVREINNRRFCAVAARRHHFGVPGSRFCSTVKETETTVALLGDCFPLVIKPAFGGAGFGLRILRQPEDFSTERSLCANYLLHGGVVIEPWCIRTADLSTAVTIDQDSGIGTIRYQRQWVNRYGTFFGIYCAEVDPIIQPWKNELERMTLAVARETASYGYSGPMGIDSFVYQDQHGNERLAAGIEINGRFTMGILGQLLRERIAPQQHTLLRFISHKKCRLPESYDRLRMALGHRIFDQETQCGILLLTPLRIGYHGRWEQPRQNVFFLAGNSLEHIERLDRELREEFARAPLAH